MAPHYAVGHPAAYPPPRVTDGELILVAGALLAAGLAASLLARRVRVPGLVLFLGLGMVIGSDGLGWIDFTTTSWRARSASSRWR